MASLGTVGSGHAIHKWLPRLRNEMTMRIFLALIFTENPISEENL
jgi:hypothetical protein